MLTSLDIRSYIPSAAPNITPFRRNKRADLVASNIKRRGNRYLIFQTKAKKSEVEVITSVVPYLMVRTDIGTPSESIAYLPNATFGGLVAFNPLVDGKSVLILENDLNAPRANAAAASLSDTDRVKRSGLTDVSDDPFGDSERWGPQFQIVLKGGALFEVTFEILPASATGALPGIPTIGSGVKRIDFAGVIVSGVVMPQKTFDDMLNDYKE